jgi:hypothetical protein
VRGNTTLLAFTSRKVQIRHTITRGILSANTLSCLSFIELFTTHDEANSCYEGRQVVLVYRLLAVVPSVHKQGRKEGEVKPLIQR